MRGAVSVHYGEDPTAEALTPVVDPNVENLQPFLNRWGIRPQQLHLKIYTLTSELLSATFWKRWSAAFPSSRFVAHPFGGSFHVFLDATEVAEQENVGGEMRGFFGTTEARFEILGCSSDFRRSRVIPSENQDELAKILKAKLDEKGLFYSPYFASLG